MKKISLMIGAIVGIAIIGAGIFTVLHEDSSIGIIGGSDGPTSIFIAEKIHK